MDYNNIKPAFAQDMVFGEPEEEENEVLIMTTMMTILTSILQPPVILDVVMKLKEQ